MRFAFVVSVGVLASQAFAFNMLHARQIEDISSLVPSECRTLCDPLFLTVESCADSASAYCVCTPAALGSLDGCFDCLIAIVEESASPSELEAFEEQADAIKDEFEIICDDAISSTSDDDLPSSTRSSSTRSSTTTSRTSTSTSDDDFTSTTTSRRATTTREQITVRPSATDVPTSDDDNIDPLLGLGAAASMGPSLGCLAVAAAGALFLL